MKSVGLKSKPMRWSDLTNKRNQMSLAYFCKYYHLVIEKLTYLIEDNAEEDSHGLLHRSSIRILSYCK